MVWKIRKKEFKGAGKEKFHLIDEEEMTRLLETFFPNYDSDLSTLPHLTRIRRKYLFPDQEIEEKGKVVKTDDDAYDGEVMEVLRCLSEVKNLTGLAFHSYNQKLASQTFSNIKGDFEVDWIFINNAGVFVIEVGLAKDESSPESIIDDKVDQIIRKTRKNIELMIESAGKTHLLENGIRYVVALPNVSIQKLKLWMVDEDHQTQLENFEPDIFFFTQETLIRHNLYRGTSLEEIELERLFTCSITDTANQTDFKYVASLILHSMNATRTPVSCARQPKPAKTKYATEQLNFEFPEDIVLSPEQQYILKDIISGEHQESYLIGDAGTGKTTVLQLLLVYYAGKKSAKKNQVIFFIPEQKWAFSLLMEKFVEEHCDQHLVRIVHTLEQWDESQKYIRFYKESVLLLSDESYDSTRLQTLQSLPGLLNSRMIFSIVNSGNETLDKQLEHVFRPFVTRYFLRLCFRNSSHLFSPAAKLKRSISASSGSHYSYLSSAQTFGVFYSGRTQLKISYIPLDENVLIEEKLVIVYGNVAGAQIHSDSTVYSVAPGMEVEDLDFTGIEEETTAVVLEPTLFKSGFISKKQRLFLYNAITRARSDAVIRSSPDVIKLIQSEIELDESDRMLELIQQGKTVQAEEMWRYYEQFNEEQRRQFEILVALSCNREIVENFLLLLESQNREKDSFLASVFSYAFLQQQMSDRSDKFLSFLNGLIFNRTYCEQKPEIYRAFLQCSLNLEYVKSYGQHFKCWDEIATKPEFEALYFMKSACVYGNLDLLREILQFKDFKVTASNIQIFCQSLCFAIHLNNAEAVQLLLPKLEPNTSDNFLFSERVDLIKPRGKEALVLFLDAFPNLLAEYSDTDGNSILHQACMTCQLKACDVIVDEIFKRRPTAFSKKNLLGYTPVDLAFMFNNSVALCVALENYWEDLISIDSFYPLSHILIALDDLEKLKVLISESPEQLDKTPADGGENIVSAACSYGKLRVVEWLISEHPKIVSASPSDVWPIAEACLNGHLDIVKLLLNFNEQMLHCRSVKSNRTLLHFAAQGGVTKVAEFLLQKDERQKLNSLDNGNESPLGIACKYNNVEMVKFLCSSTPEISKKELSKAIMVAAEFSQSSIVFCLLEKIGDFSEIVKENLLFFDLISSPYLNCTPSLGKEDSMTYVLIDMCNRGKLTTVVEFTKKFHARICNNTVLSSLPLLEACKKGRISVVTFLANYYPFTLRRHSNHLYSPLEVAVSSGHNDIVHYLCRYHLLNVFEHNLFDDLAKAIEEARLNGHRGIVKYLWHLLMSKIMILGLFVLTWRKNNSVKEAVKCSENA